MNEVKTNVWKGYSIRIFKLSEKMGGTWAAEVPDLQGCVSDGDSPEEALSNLNDAMNAWMEAAREAGTSIPEPDAEPDRMYSGKFTLRVARSIHAKLAARAEKEGVSLNQLVTSLIIYGLGALDASNRQSTSLGQNAAAREVEAWTQWP